MDYPGEKLLIRLWETLAEKGIGSLFAPWQARRMGRAQIDTRRDELLTLAQAEKDAEGIRAGKLTYQDGEVMPASKPERRQLPDGRVEPILDAPALVQEVRRRQLHEEIRKEVNVAKAVAVAEDVLEQDKQEPPDATVNEDWLYSWRDYAGRVSSEELQDLWGRVLAGEVKNPGSYSLRTLEFLKGLSKSEAEIISRVAKFVIGGLIVRNKEEFLKRGGVRFSDLLFLQELGVLSGVESIGLTSEFTSRDQDKYVQYLFAHDKVVILEGDDPGYVVELSVYLVTSIGKEILKLAAFSVDADYLESVAKGLVCEKISVKIADWVQETAETGRYSNARRVDA